jgi:hypothetical protein
MSARNDNLFWKPDQAQRGGRVRKSVSRRLVWIAVVLVASALLSACIVGSDDDPTATVEATTAPTEAASPSTAESTATATQVPSTPTPEPPTATATSTSTPSPTPTATAIPKVPLGAITALNPSAIQNFSLSTDVELRGVPNQTDFVTSLLILQSAPNHYYIRSTTGGSGLESWLVDGTTYLTQADGSVAELPDGSDTALFSPALLVQTIPTLSNETLATPLGFEDVSGRQATRYQIDAEDLLASTSWLPADVRDEDGQVDVWIDTELGIVLRQDANVTWENGDGTAGSYIIRYEVTNVGTTEPVRAPGT